MLPRVQYLFKSHAFGRALVLIYAAAVMFTWLNFAAHAQYWVPYHFYFGDEMGSPGSIMTFFPWPGARRGRQGAGQPSVTAFAILPNAVGFWTAQRPAQAGQSWRAVWVSPDFASALPSREIKLK